MQDLFLVDVQVFGHEAGVVDDRNLNGKAILVAIADLQIHAHPLILQNYDLLEALLVQFSVATSAIALDVARQGHFHAVARRFTLRVVKHHLDIYLVARVVKEPINADLADNPRALHAQGGVPGPIFEGNVRPVDLFLVHKVLVESCTLSCDEKGSLCVKNGGKGAIVAAVWHHDGVEPILNSELSPAILGQIALQNKTARQPLR